MDLDYNTYLAFRYVFETPNLTSPNRYILAYSGSNGSYDTTQMEEGISISKYDPCGNLIWHYLVEGEAALVELDIAPNGKVFIFGNADGVISYSGQSFIQPNGVKPFVLSINPNGSLNHFVYLVHPTTPNVHYLTDGLILDNSNCIISGYGMGNSFNLANTTIPSNSSFLAKLSGIQGSNPTTTFNGVQFFNNAETINEIEKTASSIIVATKDTSFRYRLMKFRLNNIGAGSVLNSPYIESMPCYQTAWFTNGPYPHIADLVVIDTTVVLGLVTRCNLDYGTDSYTRDYVFNSTTLDAGSAILLTTDTTSLIWHKHYEIPPYTIQTYLGKTAIGTGPDLDEMIATDNNELICSILANTYNLDSIGSSTESVHLLLKLSQNIEPIWVNSNETATDQNSPVISKTTAIFKAPYNSNQYAIAGTFSANQNIFDQDTITTNNNQYLHTYVTINYDFGPSNQFKNYSVDNLPDKNLDSSQYSIFTNPGETYLKIALRNNKSGISKCYIIFNSQGEQISEGKLFSNQDTLIDTSDWSTGLYLINIIDDFNHYDSFKWLKVQ